MSQDGGQDPVRGRSLWSEGAASPAAVLEYTRSGAWVPGEQAPVLERAGKAYGYLVALPVTVAATCLLWVVQRFTRLVLVAGVIAILWVTFATGGAS